MFQTESRLRLFSSMCFLMEKGWMTQSVPSRTQKMEPRSMENHSQEAEPGCTQDLTTCAQQVSVCAQSMGLSHSVWFPLFEQSVYCSNALTLAYWVYVGRANLVFFSGDLQVEKNLIREAVSPPKQTKTSSQLDLT